MQLSLYERGLERRAYSALTFDELKKMKFIDPELPAAAITGQLDNLAERIESEFRKLLHGLANNFTNTAVPVPTPGPQVGVPDDPKVTVRGYPWVSARDHDLQNRRRAGKRWPERNSERHDLPRLQPQPTLENIRPGIRAPRRPTRRVFPPQCRYLRATFAL